MKGRCIECGQAVAPLVQVHDAYVCQRCVVERFDGAIPERVSRGGHWPVYWWWCVCGRQVRRGRYTVEVDPLRLSGRIGERQAKDIERYRSEVEGVASAGVMLCKRCAAAAGVPLPAPVPLRLPSNVVMFIRRGASRKESSSVVSP